MKQMIFSYCLGFISAIFMGVVVFLTEPFEPAAREVYAALRSSELSPFSCSESEVIRLNNNAKKALDEFEVAVEKDQSHANLRAALEEAASCGSHEAQLYMITFICRGEYGFQKNLPAAYQLANRFEARMLHPETTSPYRRILEEFCGT